MDELQAKNCKHSTSVPTTDMPSLLFFPTLQHLAFCNAYHWLEFTALRHGQGSLYHKPRKTGKSGLGPTENSMINGQLTKLANKKTKESCRLHQGSYQGLDIILLMARRLYLDRFWNPEYSPGIRHVHLPSLKGIVVVRIVLLYMKHSWETMCRGLTPVSN